MSNAGFSPENPSSIKTRFALRFIRALSKLNTANPRTISKEERYRKGRAIRAAAYSSMAYSVGPRRAWTRALLRRIRTRRGRRMVMKKKRARARGGELFRRRSIRPFNSITAGDAAEEGTSEQETSLRGLVPGGKQMDFCRLLDETGHFIKCLKTQVTIMKNILDHLSN